METNQTTCVLQGREEQGMVVARPTETTIPLSSFRVNTVMSDEAIVAGAASLLMGLELRNQLTDEEKEFLDRLGADNSLTFLVREQRYIHPENVELFPLEFIEPSVWRGNSAVFSHRYESKISGKCVSHRIRTATVYPDTKKSLILGVFGPEDITSHDTNESRFFHLVELFRQAGKLVRQMSQLFDNKIPKGEPVMVINRASGRLLFVNEPAATLIRCSADELTGREYSHINNLLTPLVTDYILKMENLAVGDFNLAIITLKPSQETSPNKTASSRNNDTADPHKKLADIINAARMIELNGNSISADDIKRMAGIITSSANDIEKILNREHLFDNYNYKEKTVHQVDLRVEMERAVRNVTLQLPMGDVVELETDTVQPYVTAPYEAFMRLFESVLQTHLKASHVYGKTIVRIAQNNISDELVVAFTTNLPVSDSVKNQDNQALMETDNLANQMGVKVRRDILSDGHVMVTLLQVPVAEVVAV